MNKILIMLFSTSNLNCIGLRIQKKEAKNRAKNKLKKILRKIVRGPPKKAKINNNNLKANSQYPRVTQNQSSINPPHKSLEKREKKVVRNQSRIKLNTKLNVRATQRRNWKSS